MARFKSEFLYGLVFKWYKYIPLFFMSLAFCVMFYNDVQFLNTAAGANAIPSTMDYFLNLFNGIPIYIPSEGKPFEVPVIWFVLNLYIAFAAANYPTSDLNGVGKYMILQSKSRTKWYLGKCCWVVFSVLFCYLLIFLAPVIFSLFTGKLSFFASSDEVICAKLLANYSVAGPVYLVLSVLLLPVLTSIALSVVQLLIEFLSKPIFSFIVTVCLLIASAYLYTPFLIGNFSIMLRSEYVIENGIKFTTGAIVTLTIIVLAIVLGVLRFKKKDIGV